MTGLAGRSKFIKALGLWDVVAMNIVAVVGLRWIARSARVGAPSVTLWMLAWLVFFIPLAAALIELSSRHPEQGGIYAWVRRAFGPLHGFVCGWCMWVNNLFYFPSLLLFAAANFALVLGPRAKGSPRTVCIRWCSCSASCGSAPSLNIIGLSAGKVAAAHRQRRHVDSAGAVDRLRRHRVCELRLGHVVCAIRARPARRRADAR